MKSNTKTWLGVALAVGIFLFAAVPAWATAVAIGTGEITNIQYNLVNPADGTVSWYYDDGLGGPDWQGEAWVQVSDSDGGADADYSTIPDGLGVIDISASTSLVSGSASVDLTLEELYGEIDCTFPNAGWAFAASFGVMFDYFSISPAIPGSTDPIDMFFSFDYEIHLTGQAEPGAGYYSDGSVNLKLEYEGSDWQLVPDGQLFYSEAISGSGTDSDDVTFSGQLSMTVALDPDTNHAIQFTADSEVPEPTTLLLLGLGSLALRRKRR